MSQTENQTEQVTETIAPETASEQALLKDLAQADAEHIADDAPPVDETELTESKPDEPEVEPFQKAQFEATLALMGIEGAIKMFIHPRFAFDDDARAQTIEAFGPLLIKYGNVIPDWFAKYEAEINAGYAAVQLVGSSASKLKQLKAEDLATLEAANDEQEAETEAA
ncbi:hypothetical protein [Thaumasiovibrio subtropicus]|uniref:hypothetical protein n=1 Tax=Thaumasiovibrio subtropicus TaxID=1891207 RepID=UPI000B35AF0F|nr:hypothetical protein [Thaumasiovibrio subtropicus]